VTIGDKVYLAPLVQILAVNHVFSDPTRPIIEQGITQVTAPTLTNDMYGTLLARSGLFSRA